MIPLPPRVVTTSSVGVSETLATDLLELPGATVARLLKLDNGVSVQLLRLTVDQPGEWRRVPTQDIVSVLEGELVVELEADGEHVVRAGETLVQRGTRHRLWAPHGAVTALVTHIEAHAGASAAELEIWASEPNDAPRAKRIVTGLDRDGRSCVVHDGEPRWVLQPSDRVLMADLWQTGGPLSSVEQGGDAEPPWQRDPVGSGVLAGYVRLGPGDYDHPDAWHTTATVDVDVITAGTVELWLRDAPPVVVSAGDVVIQGGVDHRWQPVGEEVVEMVTVMIGVP